MRYFDLKFRKLCHYPLKPLQVAACYSIVWLWRYCGIYVGKKNIDDRRKKQVWPKVSVPTVMPGPALAIRAGLFPAEKTANPCVTKSRAIRHSCRSGTPPIYLEWFRYGS